MKRKLKRNIAVLSAIAMVCTTAVVLPEKLPVGVGIMVNAEDSEIVESNSWLEVSCAENNYKTMDYTSSDGNSYTCYVYSSTEYNAVLISANGWSYGDHNGVLGYDNQVADLASKGARMPKFAELQILLDAGVNIGQFDNFNCQEYEVAYVYNGEWIGQDGNDKYDDSIYHAVFEINRNPIETVSDSIFKTDSSPTLSTVKGEDFTWQGNCDIEISYYNSDKTICDSAPAAAGDYYVKVSTPTIEADEDGNTVRYEASESDYIPFTIGHDMEATPTPNSDGTHSLNCKVCEYAETENCTYGEYTIDETNHTRTCTECGYEDIEAHAIKLTAAADSNNIITLSESCDTCGYSKEFGDVTVNIPELICGETEKSVTLTGIPENWLAMYKVDDANAIQNADGDTETSATLGRLFGNKKMTAGEHKLKITFVNTEYTFSNECELPFTVRECPHEDSVFKATANNDGTHTLNCERCGYEKSEVHNLTKIEAAEPTCTENGNTAYWYCDVCNAYFSDANCTTEITLADTVLTANGHNYVDGKCTECGVFENGIGERLEGYSLSLDGNIGVNFYMELDKSVIADENAYMQFTLPNGETSKVLVSDAKQQTVNGNIYYVFSCEVNAKEMTDTITAQIITSDNESDIYKYSVEEYIQYIRGNSSEFDEKTISLVDAMAEYGDYARAYFNNEKVDATPEMDAVTADTLAGYEKQTSGELPEGITYYGSSLLLESNTTIRHYFKAADGTDVSAYGFIEKDGYYYKEITDISADKLGMAQNVTVGGFTISYSPLSYAYTVLKSDSTDESLKNLVKALYLYEQAAEAYKMTEVI